MTTYEQITLLPPDRVHLTFDVYAVGPAGSLAVTATVREGTDETLIVLETTGFELGNEGQLAATQWLAGRLMIALAVLSPF